MQIKIRWLSFILFGIAIAIIWGMKLDRNMSMAAPTELKALFVHMNVLAEYAPLWVWPVVFSVINVLLYIGVPSILCFAILYSFIGFNTAFLVTFMCQIFVTKLAIRSARNKIHRSDYKKKLSPDLNAKLQQSSAKFAFWSRLYYPYPLRTIDKLTPIAESGEESIMPTLALSYLGIFFRIIPQTLWLDSFINLCVNVSPNPENDFTKFLIWSSLILAYTVLPKIPELFICPKDIKDVLYIIDGSTVEEKPV